jgi:hypothetical protein
VRIARKRERLCVKKIHNFSVQCVGTYSKRYTLNGLLPIRASRGRDSSVGIATGYGLDGPGIENERGRDFSHTSRPALGPTQHAIQLVPGFSRG